MCYVVSACGNASMYMESAGVYTCLLTSTTSLIDGGRCPGSLQTPGFPDSRLPGFPDSRDSQIPIFPDPKITAPSFTARSFTTVPPDHLQLPPLLPRLPRHPHPPSSSPLLPLPAPPALFKQRISGRRQRAVRLLQYNKIRFSHFLYNGNGRLRVLRGRCVSFLFLTRFGKLFQHL